MVVCSLPERNICMTTHVLAVPQYFAQVIILHVMLCTSSVISHIMTISGNLAIGASGLYDNKRDILISDMT